MRVRKTGEHDDKIELQMTPMIDIVFQLLVFFIMTFKIIQPEGDFNIRMPLNAPAEGPPDENQLPPMNVRLTANETGDLSGVYLNEQSMGGQPFAMLRSEIMKIIGDDRGPNSLAATAEVEIDADYDLHYKYVIETISAVSGRIDESGQPVKLIEKIKFAPPDTGGL